MNKEQALKLLKEATGLLQLKREEHIAIQQALEVVGQAIADKEEQKEAKKKKS